MGIICVCEFTSEACHFVYKKKKKNKWAPYSQMEPKHG